MNFTFSLFGVAASEDVISILRTKYHCFIPQIVVVVVVVVITATVGYNQDCSVPMGVGLFIFPMVDLLRSFCVLPCLHTLKLGQ